MMGGGRGKGKGISCIPSNFLLRPRLFSFFVVVVHYPLCCLLFVLPCQVVYVSPSKPFVYFQPANRLQQLRSFLT